MTELINALGLDWKMLIAQLVNFVILIVVLYFFAYKPILKTLRKRTEKIEKSVKKADEIDELMSKTEADYRKKLAQAQAEADKIIDKAKTEGEKHRQEQLENARQEAEIIVSEARKSLDGEKEKIIGEIKDDIKDLVLATSKKVLQREITGADTDKIIEETIKK